MAWSLNPSGSYSSDVDDKAGEVLGFKGELSRVLVASRKPSSRSFAGFVYLMSKFSISGAGAPNVGSFLLWSFTWCHWFWCKQTGVLCRIVRASSRQKA